MSATVKIVLALSIASAVFFGTGLPAASAGASVDWAESSNTNDNGGGVQDELMRAVFRGADTECLAALIQKGADVDRANLAGVTPLMLAAMANSDPGTVGFLLQAGAEPAGRVADSDLLLLAAAHNPNPDVLRAIIAAGPPRLVSIRFRALEASAASNPRAEILALLMPFDSRQINAVTRASPEERKYKDEYFPTALVRVLEAGGGLEACRVLLEGGADPLLVSGGRSALTSALLLPRPDAVQLFFSRDIRPDWDNVLLTAAQAADAETMRTAFDGFRPSEKDRLKLLQEAAWVEDARYLAITEALKREIQGRPRKLRPDREQTLEMLLERFTVNEDDVQKLLGEALRSAARSNPVLEVSDFLLGRMTDVTRADPKSLLYWLGAAVENPNPAVVGRLLELVNPEDLSEYGVLFNWAVSSKSSEGLPEIFRLLWDAGIRPTSTTGEDYDVLGGLVEQSCPPQRKTPAFLAAARFLLQAEADPRKIDENRTLLEACRPGCMDMARALLDAGANAPVTGPGGRGALHHLLSAADEVSWYRDDEEGLVPYMRLLAAAGASADHAGATGRTPLFEAAERGNLPAARFLIEAGADVNAIDAAGFSPINETYKRGDAAMADLLLKAGAVVDPENPAHRMLLHDAERYGRGGLAELLASSLAARGLAWPPEEPRQQFYVPETLADAVTFTGDTAAVKRFLAGGSDPNGRDGDGRSILSLAVAPPGDELLGSFCDPSAPYLMTMLESGRKPGQFNPAPFVRTETIVALIEAGARVGPGSEGGGLLIAAMRNEADIRAVRALCGAGAGFSALENAGLDAYRAAAGNGDPEVLRFVCGELGPLHPDAFGNAIFRHALEYNRNPGVAELFIEWGFSPDGTDGPDEKPPIVAAATNKRGAAGAMAAMLAGHGADGVTAVIAAAGARQPPREMRRILGLGADADAVAHDGDTALHRACRAPYVHFERLRPFVLKTLLLAGADPNRRDADGRSPLLLVAANQGSADAAESMAVLLEHGADPSALDAEGRSVVDCAIENQGFRETMRCIALLSGHGGTDFSETLHGLVDARGKAMKNTDPMRIQIAEALVLAGARPEKPDRQGVDILMKIAFRWEDGAKEFADWLLSRGLNPERRDTQGRTALMWAASGEGNPDVFRLLLAAGADVDAQDESGKTALMYLLENGQLTAERREALAALLLGGGADVHLRDNSGTDALDYALTHYGSPLILRRLRDSAFTGEPTPNGPRNAP